MRRAAEGGTRRREKRCDQTGKCQEWEPGEQEEVVERGQLEIAGQAGPGFPGPAGSCHAQHDFLDGGAPLIDHHPAVVQRVARLGRVLPRSTSELGFEGFFLLSSVPMQDL